MVDSGSGFLMKLQSGWGCGLCRLEQAGNFTSKMVYAHGFWQEASVLHHVGLSLGLLERPPNMASGQGSDLRAQEEGTVPFRQQSGTSPL